MTTRLRTQTALGRRVWDLRDHAHLTQQQLAARAGVSLSVLQKIEQGVLANPRLHTMRRLAGALNITIAEMLDYEEPEEELVDDDELGADSTR